MFSFLENHVLQCILTLKFPEVIQILPIISIHLLINIKSIILLTQRDFKNLAKDASFLIHTVIGSQFLYQLI